MKKLILCLGILIFIPTMSLAEEKRWNDEAEFSFVNTGGNAEMKTLLAKNTFWYKFSEKNETKWDFSALYGEAQGEKTAEEYYTNLYGYHYATERFYLMAIAGWLKNEFSGLDPRVYIGPSLGYKFLSAPRHNLLGEAGVEYVYDQYIDDTKKEYLRGRIYGKYSYKFSDKNIFYQEIALLPGFDEGDNYYIISNTELVTTLTSLFALKLGYEVRYNNRPIPSDLDKTDTIFSMRLVVNFN